MTARYGTVHQRLRARWAVRLAAGHVTCPRCGEPITAADPWDLGHDDRDPTRWTGPEHLRCNRATATHRATLRRRPPEPHPGVTP